MKWNNEGTRVWKHMGGRTERREGRKNKRRNGKGRKMRWKERTEGKAVEDGTKIAWSGTMKESESGERWSRMG